ncbi:hypothetical protein F3J45_00360 [Pantoea sp. Ap-967]|uniref:Zn-ribbon domain-containing OB-fold protein n=1 Tax=Pantoea sp. Ap-967 TaxID=2608362 RepID=UPI0014204E37|nr:hypothetical protein [Pantoea sp. Ap-967]
MSRIPSSPQPWPETARFWDAANEGKFLLQRCVESGRAFFYPRSHSPFTGGECSGWFEASGNAILYTFSVSQRAEPPYCLAYVTLEEGPTILTNIVASDFSALQIGQQLRLIFSESATGQKVPMFSPA